MSISDVRQALEIALNGISPAVDIAWENDDYEPVVGTPYQKAYLLPGTPENIEIGPLFREVGVFQVSLFYPLQAGVGDATARANLIRDTFFFGETFTNDGVDVIIKGTPKIYSGRRDGDRWMIVVDVPFFAHITT